LSWLLLRKLLLSILLRELLSRLLLRELLSGLLLRKLLLWLLRSRLLLLRELLSWLLLRELLPRLLLGELLLICRTLSGYFLVSECLLKKSQPFIITQVICWSLTKDCWLLGFDSDWSSC